jgi:hypothetical protein
MFAYNVLGGDLGGWAGFTYIYEDRGRKGLEETKMEEIERKRWRKEVGGDDNKGTDQRDFCFVKKVYSWPFHVFGEFSFHEVAWEGPIGRVNHFPIKNPSTGPQ